MKGVPQSFRNKNGKPRQMPAGFAVRPIAGCVMLACCAAAWANPSGPQVAAGAASFQAAGKTLNVTNAPGTIINWRTFSIGAGEQTRFLQQSAASAVLNRVVGSDASSILGTLSSNGRVFLINPHGIVFGVGSVIDTAGFIASTLNIADRDFLQGKFQFDGGGNGVLRNEGIIRAGGDIMLVGPQIENAGLIRSDGGSVLLAAGKSVTITSPDAQGLKFALQAPTDTALNLGAIEARNAVRMFAGTLIHSGRIRTAASVDSAGRVVLSALKDASVESGSTVSASGAHGGSITIQSGDTTLLAGKVDATGGAGRGGTVEILGNRVGLVSGASVDASGETGGGTILVGGDYQGGNPGVQNAWRTFAGAETALRADAIRSGDGGKVIVWSDDITRYSGSVSVRGGAQAGNGGFVEVSGKRFLDFRGTADTRAPRGRAGTLLLDATDTNIVALGSGLPLTEFAGGLFQEAGVIDPVSEITTDALLNALLGGNVIISTQSAAGSPGNISFLAPFNFDGIGNKTLELRANNNANISNSIFDGGGNGDTLNVMLNTGGVTNISADVMLGAGLLDAASAGSGIVNISGGTPLIANAFNVGTLNVSGGIARLAGPLNAAAALNLTGGMLDAQNGLLPRLNMTGGVLTRTTAGDVTIAGAFNVSGGVILGGFGGNLTTAGVTTVTNPVIATRDWVNTGTLNLNAGRISLEGLAPLFSNQGTVNLNTPDPLPFGVSAAAAIINDGTINKNEGSAFVQTIDAMLANTFGGRINVISGTLAANDFPVNDGIIDIGLGGTFSTGANALTNGASGLLTGNGVLDLGGATLINNGTIAPGTSPGTFTILGNLLLGASSEYLAEIGRTMTGINYDLVFGTGAASLNGMLVVSFFPGSLPVLPGDVFTPLEFGMGIFGNFAETIFPTGSGLQAVLTPNSYEIIAAGGLSSQNTMAANLARALPANNAQVLFERNFANMTPPNGAPPDGETRRLAQECR